MEGDKYLQEFLVDTSMFNSIVLGHLLPSNWWVTLPHFLQTWLRNYIAGTLLYFISGFLWCFYIYYLKRNVYVPKGRTLFFIMFFLIWDWFCSVLEFFNLGFCLLTFGLISFSPVCFFLVLWSSIDVNLKSKFVFLVFLVN